MNSFSSTLSWLENVLLTNPKTLEAFRTNENLINQVMNDKSLTEEAKERIMQIIRNEDISPGVKPMVEGQNETKDLNKDANTSNENNQMKVKPVQNSSTIHVPRPSSQIFLRFDQPVSMPSANMHQTSSENMKIEGPMNSNIQTSPINSPSRITPKPINTPVSFQPSLETSNEDGNALVTSSDPNINHDHWGRVLTMKNLKFARRELKRYNEEWKELIKFPMLSWYLNDDLVIRLNIEQSILELLFGPTLPIQEQLGLLRDLDFPLFGRPDKDKSIPTEYERWGVKHPMKAHRFTFKPNALNWVHAFIYCLFRCV